MCSSDLVDLKRVGKRPLEMLARAGAFDILEPNRRRVFESLDALVGYSSAVHEQRASNQVSLFGEAGEDLPEPRLSPVEDWLPAERLSQEFAAVGFYLSGHPLDDYMGPLRRKDVLTLDDVMEKVQGGPLVAKLAGVVAGRQERKSARGNRFAFAQMSDPTGAYEVTLFSETLENARDHLETGSKVIVTVEATLEADQLKLLGRSVAPIDVIAADAGGMGLKVYVEEPAALPSVAKILSDAAETVKRARPGPIYLCLMADEREVEIDTGTEYPVTPEIKGAIKGLPGVMAVEDV